jgi:signal transduction histidine kinase
MPEFFRMTGFGSTTGSRRYFAAACPLRAGSSLGSLIALVGQACAQDVAGERSPGGFAVAAADAIRGLDDRALAALALFAIVIFLGVVAFAFVTAVMLLRTREHRRIEQVRARSEAAALEGTIDRLYGLLLAEPQIIVSWERDTAPEVIGDPAIIAAGLAAENILNFAAWLRPEQAYQLQSAIDRLLGRGEGFTLSLTSAAGRYLTAEGRAIGGSAVLRINDVTGVKKDLAELNHRYHRLQADTDAVRALIDALPSPVWTRDASGRLAFANPAYARAVETADVATAVSSRRELLDSGTREDIERSRGSGAAYSGRAAVIVAGARRIFDILEVPNPRGSAGIGRDSTEIETLRAEIERAIEAHRRILDQLSTAVAIFGPDHSLTFYNAAYQALWDLDPHFLDQGPSDSVVLDRLRAGRRLPEQSDFRAWKAALHKAYHAQESAKYEWHLPDQRTLRVVTTPNPDGGVTYLFDDVTERLNLERRFDALIRVQGETLDNLAEAVALFGSNGRIRLFNPAFVQMWQLPPALVDERPHIEAVIARARTYHRDEETWDALRAAVTALDRRSPIYRRIERTDGTVVDCRTVPMPDGATLVTFQDVTDSVNVERVLTESNKALVEADKIKIDFVRHVSYELRSPLTNIIGFAHFLGDPSTGPLTAKQSEYLGYIMVSSNALLAIINNILDLASIDAGAMALDLEPVDIRATMDAAAEGVQDRIVNNNIRLEINVPPDIGSFVADERRIRQILFNLLSNAVGFSPPGETVMLSAARGPDTVTFTVSDHGPGIPPELQDRVFELFETDARGTPHRGAGLGLSIVRSFVELHHGTVQIESVPGEGTTVVCIFPLAIEAAKDAAE